MSSNTRWTIAVGLILPLVTVGGLTAARAVGRGQDPVAAVFITAYLIAIVGLLTIGLLVTGAFVGVREFRQQPAEFGPVDRSLLGLAGVGALISLVAGIAVGITLLTG